jgi:tRNA 2-thiocytidine biosynthesis protein TtcA
VVIRPLLECAEADITRHAKEQDYPILECTVCAEQDGRREAMARLISRLEAESPTVRQSMLAAIKNVQPTHLLDPTIARRLTTEPPS